MTRKTVGKNQGGSVFTGIPANYGVIIFRDRKVSTRTVVCPTCQAAIGAPCVTVEDGAPKAACHVTRRRMALRAERKNNP